MPPASFRIQRSQSFVSNGAMDGTLLPNDGAVTAGRDESSSLSIPGIEASGKNMTKKPFKMVIGIVDVIN